MRGNDTGTRGDGDTEIVTALPLPPVSASPAQLTERQTEVLGLVASGLTYKEVGRKLSLSEITVRYHMSEIIHLLHLENRSQVIAYAARHNLTK